MKPWRNTLILATGMLVFISCGKNKATSIDPLFTGTWHHYKTFEVYKTLVIESDSKGYIYTSQGYHDGAPEDNTGFHRWFYKAGELRFGTMPRPWEKFQVDSLPAIADTNFSSDYTYCYIGEKFMWLDGELFVSDD